MEKPLWLRKSIIVIIVLKNFDCRTSACSGAEISIICGPGTTIETWPISVFLQRYQLNTPLRNPVLEDHYKELGCKSDSLNNTSLNNCGTGSQAFIPLLIALN